MPSENAETLKFERLDQHSGFAVSTIAHGASVGILLVGHHGYSFHGHMEKRGLWAGQMIEIANFMKAREKEEVFDNRPPGAPQRVLYVQRKEHIDE